MRQGAKTGVTVVVLGVVLLVGAAWGWSALTQPLPGKVELPTCVKRSVAQGEKVYPDQVVVTVFNAGTREGLAGRTMQLLTDQGFAEGDSGNAPADAEVPVAQIWAADPRNPAVRLVAARFAPEVEIVQRNSRGAGVVVVVGDGFRELAKGRPSVRAGTDAEICSPPE
jgi:hypothetical protein